MDVRGRGGSVATPPPYDLPTISDDITRALDQLGIDRAAVVGYSMGAWIAAIFGQRHAGRTTSALLVDGGLALPLDPTIDADDHIQAMVGPSLARLGIEFESKNAFIEYWKKHPALDGYWEDSIADALTHELIERKDHFAVSINPQAVTVGARQITVDPETHNAGADLDVPAQVIVADRGTADQKGGMVPLETARRAVAENPKLSMQFVEDVNHYTLLLGKGAPRVAAAIDAL